MEAHKEETGTCEEDNDTTEKDKGKQERKQERENEQLADKD